MRKIPATPRRRRRTVAVIIFEGVHPFELAVPCEVFGLDRSYLGVPWYEFFVASADPTPVTTDAGFTIDTPYTLADLDRADTIVMPGWDSPDEPSGALLEALRRAHDRGTRILSVCSGAIVLAAAGLLDGRRATTHWAWTDQLERYPNIEVEPGVLYVDEGQVMTSAGTAAGIDLCLHVVRQDYGVEIANAVARRMVVPPHRDGGQAQYVEAPVRDADEENGLGATLEWMQANLDQELPVRDLAARAAMSPRTFARRFRAATGTTPHRWLIRQRVLLAQRLLETTDDPIDRVATGSGFGTAANLRQHFRREVRR